MHSPIKIICLYGPMYDNKIYSQCKFKSLNNELQSSYCIDFIIILHRKKRIWSKNLKWLRRQKIVTNDVQNILNINRL